MTEQSHYARKLPPLRTAVAAAPQMGGAFLLIGYIVRSEPMTGLEPIEFSRQEILSPAQMREGKKYGGK